MPTSGTGRPTRRRPRDAGLTLIELVVVMAILSLLAMPVALRFGGGAAFGGAPPAQRIAAALRSDLATLHDRSLLGRQVLELQPDAQGWTAATLDKPARFDGVRLVWTPPEAPVRFLPDGRGTPFALRISTDEGARLDCRFDGWEGLECR